MRLTRVRSHIRRRRAIAVSNNNYITVGHVGGNERVFGERQKKVSVPHSFLLSGTVVDVASCIFCKTVLESQFTIFYF